MATKALTLGNLATSNAMNQYQLQSVQDLPAAMQLASSYKNPSDAMPEIMQKFPRAAAQVAGLIKQWELKQAQTEEAQGKGAAARSDAFKGAMTLVGNQANGIINQSEPLTPFQKQSLAAQAQHAATIGGYDPGQLPVPPVMAQDIDWKRFAQGSRLLPRRPSRPLTFGRSRPLRRRQRSKTLKKATSQASTPGSRRSSRNTRASRLALPLRVHRPNA